MNAKADEASTGLDTAKLGGAVLLLLGGIYGFYHYDTYATLYRVLGLLTVVGVSAVLLMATASGRQLWEFAQDSRVEVRKVVWPTRQETMQTTLMVFAMVLIMGVTLWVVDLVLMAIVRAVTG